jgi:hypothetical protein
MTAKELKQVVDEYLGMVGTLTVKGHKADIHYVTPTGVTVMHVGLGQYDGEWSCSGFYDTGHLTDAVSRVLHKATASA